ncbi:capsid protein [Bodo saltans virus]|uniref:Capsid protein n=1 Tax=Bodo saltans virus TaxID=2024608 RepID=A0A2H4UUK7_9VIRU|nr:capsid protein [Bodo saltans virus]ATZ80554.1 capsid protein [Bodo saltans virus]
MTGGLINIISYGADDLYLTGSPQMTFFKSVYRRYTNFSKESISIPLGSINFNKTLSIELSHIGDLISNTYLQINIPQMNILKVDTASDLTVAQYNILNTPYPVSYPDSQPNFTSDYTLIKQYMTVNMTGYRTALSLVNVKNQTVLQYISSITNAIQIAATQPEIIQNYQLALNNAFKFEMENITTTRTTITTTTQTYNTQMMSTNNASIQNELTRVYNNTINQLNQQLQTNITNASLLNFNSTDINYILTTLANNITTNTQASVYGFTDSTLITAQDVLDIIINAVAACKLVTNYYFLNVQRINNDTADSQSQYAKFAWNEKLGYSIIDYVEIQIGGEVIDKHYGDFMDIWTELTMQKEQNVLYNKMLGNVIEMTTYDRNAKPSYNLLIPFNFWFCKKNGLAFPLIALQYNRFFVNIKFKNIERCAYIEPLPTVDQNGNYVDFTQNALQLTDIWENSNLSLTGNLLVDYIYLESQERTRFAKSAHEYLIEAVETQQLINLSNVSEQIELNFTGTSKELIFVCQKNAYVNNYNSNLRCINFDYSTIVNTNINPIVNAQLILHNQQRFSKAEFDYATDYLNVVSPYMRHSNVPFKGINDYSFALYPEEHQPSGTCNFTRISYPILDLTLNPNIFQYSIIDVDPNITSANNVILPTDISITVYSVKYRILRIINGMACFAFY